MTDLIRCCPTSYRMPCVTHLPMDESQSKRSQLSARKEVCESKLKIPERELQPRTCRSFSIAFGAEISPVRVAFTLPAGWDYRLRGSSSMHMVGPLKLKVL